VNFWPLAQAAANVILVVDSKATSRQVLCERYQSDVELSFMRANARFEVFIVTRTSADADKPARRIYRSIKVNKHSTIPYVRYSFLLCNSNFVVHILRYSSSKMLWPWNPGQRSLKVTESGIIQQIAYDILLVLCRNFVPKALSRFWDMWLQKCCDLKNLVRVRQGYWKCHHAI